MKRLVRPVLAAPDMTEQHVPALRMREIFTRFWPDARPFRSWLVLSLALVVLAPLLDTATIWLFKLLIDDVLVAHRFSAFLPIAITYLAVTGLIGVVEFADDYLSAWIGENFLHRLRTRVFAHLHTLSVSFFDRRPLGDTLSRLTTDVGAIENMVLSGVTTTAAHIIKVWVFAGVLCYLSWPLALGSAITMPLFWLVARFFSRRIKTISGQVRQRTGEISALAEQSLGNATLIQVYGRQQAEVARFTDASRANLAAELAATRWRAAFSPLVDLLEVAGVMIILGLGVWELTSNRITLGGLLVFLVYLSQLASPLRGLGQLATTIHAAATSAERIIDLLDQQPEIRAPAHPVRLPRPSGTLSVEQVSFRYPGATTDTLREISFTVPAGRSIALVGASGAGKTTLTKLLLRLHDPTRGVIRLDGIDIRDLDPEQLRASIAAVLQETLLLDGTILENIRAGRPDATPQDVVAAAVAADAHEFITALPRGYLTPIGQRGRLLSGGQRQRIAIARAMIRDAPLLILDEPTTGLDAHSCERILSPLRRLMAGRTTIIISHHLATVAGVDQIIYLDRGRIVRRDHRTLVRNWVTASSSLAG
jgi:ABC-type multidrug transport system fused ATPase/permease subunit